MPIGKSKLHLLAYDIADPKRLAKVHRTVREWGVPLQYSVFLVPAAPRDLETLLGELRHIIEPGSDDIRVYAIPSRIELIHYGRRSLPEGVDLAGELISTAILNALVGVAS